MILSHRLFKRALTTSRLSYTQDFTFWPQFFSPYEQTLLLRAALRKLDLTESKVFRRRRKTLESRMTDQTSPENLFLADEYYDFQKGHYDGVIRHFREIHLASWPEDEIPGLSPVLTRLYSLCPTQDTQTHLLHLASCGEILPHVDNLSASGSWILGVSLGSQRILRMQAASDSFDVSLPSGSVYLQRDAMRFTYKHSILPCNSEGEIGQRLSIMIRDLPVTRPEHRYEGV